MSANKAIDRRWDNKLFSLRFERMRLSGYGASQSTRLRPGT
jgi:hypothetical protein